MDPNLPPTPSLNEIQKSNSRYGRKKTMLDQFQVIFPYLIIFGAIGFGSIVLNNFNDRLKTIENLYNSNSNSNTNNVTVNSNNSNSISESPDQLANGDVLGLDTPSSSSGFNLEDWIISGFKVDDQGYFCPNKKGFDYWSIWSRKNYPPLMSKIRIKLAIKQIKQTDKPPTIAISYGEYKANKSPIQFYRFNIFDTDTKSFRLYNSKNESKAQDWLELEPDLDSEMTIILSPASSDRESRVISLNPTFIYVNSDNPNQITFKANTKFNVELPTVGINDKTVQKQIGIGSSDGVCFKVVDFEAE